MKKILIVIFLIMKISWIILILLLNEERKKNQDLINENSNLKNIIINLKSELAQKDEIKNLLENQLIKAKEELQKYQSKNFIQTGDSMISINPGDKILGVNFVSMGNNDIGHFHLICKNTDLFVSLEARLYESYPQFKDFETYFEVKTKRIKRFKTLDENGIKSNDIINIFTVEWNFEYNINFINSEININFHFPFK